MKRLRRIFVLGVMAFGLAAPASFAGEIDMLLKTLVNKGYLTQGEAQQIATETKEEVRKEVAQGKSYAVPEWVQKTKLKGDVRVRYQYERKHNDTDSRDRGRVRYRLGLEHKVNDQVKVGAGLASGGADPRSTNQTFENTFSTGDVRLDYAYGEYTPNSNVSAIVGIFQNSNYLWRPTDLLWDSDINPAGASVHLEKGLDNIQLFANTGVWVVDESPASDKPDPFIVYVQGGASWKDAEEKLSAKVAGTYYSFNSVKQQNLDWGSGTNTGRVSCSSSTGSCTGAPIYDFDSVGASAEFGVKELFGGLPFGADDYVAIFGDFIHNVDPKEQNNGFAAGLKFGDKKVGDKGQWQAKYLYANLGKDAWYDAFPDSDRYSGGTDVRSHEAILEYGLMKNVILGLDYYQSQRIKGSKDLQHLVQADVVFKF